LVCYHYTTIPTFFKEIVLKKLTAVILLACLALAALIFWPAAPGVPVLGYHRITAGEPVNKLFLPRGEFARQMAYLHANGYTAITPEQLAAYLNDKAPLPAKSVLITFDDGYADNYWQAFPILRQYNFTALIFLITDEIGIGENYLTWPQVREMRQAGLHFGSHTASHADLTALDAAGARRELGRSASRLWQEIGRPSPWFAYPGGAYNQKTLDLLKDSSYRLAFSIRFGRARADSDPYAVERLPILYSPFSFADFYLRLKFTAALQRLKLLRDWLRPLL
jgi:peptidoglycan/xylan/chitin deacetylase (PgdA/CDA1 family)